MTWLDSLRATAAREGKDVMDPIDLLSPANQRIAQLERECEIRRLEHIATCKRVDELEADNAKLRAEVAALRGNDNAYADVEMELHASEKSNAKLRARLALAEAVAENFEIWFALRDIPCDYCDSGYLDGSCTCHDAEDALDRVRDYAKKWRDAKK